MTTQTRNDPIARYAVFALISLALWAGVRQIQRPAQAQGDPGIIILQATPTPALPTPLAPALAIAQPTAAPELSRARPDPGRARCCCFPAPVWTAEQLQAPAPEVIAATEQAPPPAADPALQYGTPEFNAALVEAHQALPVLECPCGIDTTREQPTAKDYAYSKARTR